MRNRRLVFLAIVTTALLLSFACHKNVTPHPDQINAFDGKTYDTLVSAQAALEEAKVQYRAGKLSGQSKSVINGAGAAYEQARSSWQLWRDTTLGLKAGDAQALQLKLQADLQQLSEALADVRRVTGGHQ